MSHLQRPQFREEELRERARQLLENVRKESSANEDINRPHSNSSSLLRVRMAHHFIAFSSVVAFVQEQDERQRALRERARKLIADARQGIIAGSSLDSPGSMASNSTTNSTNTPVMSPLEVYSGFEQVNGCSLVDSSTHKYMIKSDFDKTKASQPSSGKAVTDVASTPKTIPPNKGTPGALVRLSSACPSRTVIARLHHFVY